MRRIFTVGLLALLLAGCSATSRERNTITGAAIGAGTGALIGHASSGPAGGWAGAAIGGVAGGMIGYLVSPSGRCYVRTKRGKLRRIACP